MNKKENGSILLASWILMIIVSTTLLSLLSQMNSLQRITENRLLKMQAYYAAISGITCVVTEMDNLPITNLPSDKAILYQSIVGNPYFMTLENTKIYLIRTPDTLYSIGIANNLGRCIIQAQYKKNENQYKITHWKVL